LKGIRLQRRLIRIAVHLCRFVDVADTCPISVKFVPHLLRMRVFIEDNGFRFIEIKN
jgi:hypothetical protein